jgi:hypothetical protein
MEGLHGLYPVQRSGAILSKFIRLNGSKDPEPRRHEVHPALRSIPQNQRGSTTLFKSTLLERWHTKENEPTKKTYLLPFFVLFVPSW